MSSNPIKTFPFYPQSADQIEAERLFDYKEQAVIAYPNTASKQMFLYNTLFKNLLAKKPTLIVVPHVEEGLDIIQQCKEWNISEIVFFANHSKSEMIDALLHHQSVMFKGRTSKDQWLNHQFQLVQLEQRIQQVRNDIYYNKLLGERSWIDIATERIAIQRKQNQWIPLLDIDTQYFEFNTGEFWFILGRMEDAAEHYTHFHQFAHAENIIHAAFVKMSTYEEALDAMQLNIKSLLESIKQCYKIWDAMAIQQTEQKVQRRSSHSYVIKQLDYLHFYLEYSNISNAALLSNLAPLGEKEKLRNLKTEVIKEYNSLQIPLDHTQLDTVEGILNLKTHLQQSDTFNIITKQENASEKLKMWNALIQENQLLKLAAYEAKEASEVHALALSLQQYLLQLLEELPQQFKAYYNRALFLEHQTEKIQLLLSKLSLHDTHQWKSVFVGWYYAQVLSRHTTADILQYADIIDQYEQLYAGHKEQMLKEIIIQYEAVQYFGVKKLEKTKPFLYQIIKEKKKPDCSLQDLMSSLHYLSEVFPIIILTNKDCAYLELIPPNSFSQAIILQPAATLHPSLYYAVMQMSKHTGFIIAQEDQQLMDIDLTLQAGPPSRFSNILQHPMPTDVMHNLRPFVDFIASQVDQCYCIYNKKKLQLCFLSSPMQYMWNVAETESVQYTVLHLQSDKETFLNYLMMPVEQKTIVVEQHIIQTGMKSISSPEWHQFFIKIIQKAGFEILTLDPSALYSSQVFLSQTEKPKEQKRVIQNELFVNGEETPTSTLSST